MAGAAGLATVLVALFGGWLRERTQSPSVGPSLTQFTWSLPAGTGLDSAPVVSPDGRRIAFTAVSGECGATPVRAVARLARGHGHRRYRRRQAAVLVARRHVARVLCLRQADESGRRGRRAGRHVRCAGREGRHVESFGDDRVQSQPDLRGTRQGVGGRRRGGTRHAARLRPW